MLIGAGITNRSRDYKLAQKRVAQLSRSSYNKSASNECFISIPIKKMAKNKEYERFDSSEKDFVSSIIKNMKTRQVLS